MKRTCKVFLKVYIILLRQRISKDATELVICCCPGAWPEVWSVSTRETFGENWFVLCKWLSTGHSFLVGDGDMCPLLLSALGSHLAQPHADPVRAAMVSALIRLLALLCLECLAPLMSSLLALTAFPLPLPLDFLSPEERDLLEISQLGLSVPRSLTFYTMSNCGYLFPPAAEESFSDDGWAKPFLWI